MLAVRTGFTVLSRVDPADGGRGGPVGVGDREAVGEALGGLGHAEGCCQRGDAVLDLGDGRRAGRGAGDGEGHKVQAELAQVGGKSRCNESRHDKKKPRCFDPDTRGGALTWHMLFPHGQTVAEQAPAVTASLSKYVQFWLDISPQPMVTACRSERANVLQEHHGLEAIPTNNAHLNNSN